MLMSLTTILGLTTLVVGPGVRLLNHKARLLAEGAHKKTARASKRVHV